MRYVPDLPFSNSSKDFPAVSDYLAGLAVNLFSDAINILLGVVANVLLFACIVSSKPLRRKLRNCLISSIALAHILKVLYFVSLHLLHLGGYHSLLIFYTKCADVNYTFSAGLLEGVVVKYTIFILSAVYLYQVLKLSFGSNLTDKKNEMNHATLVFVPWALGLIAAPPNLSWFGFGGYPCIELDGKTPYVLLVIYSIGPLSASICAVTLAVLLRFKSHRSVLVTRNCKVVDRREGGAEIDTPLAYIAIVTVCVFCEAGQIMRFFGLASLFDIGYTFQAATVALDTSRMVLLPMAWLFFPDIRHRLQSWIFSSSTVTAHQTLVNGSDQKKTALTSSNEFVV